MDRRLAKLEYNTRRIVVYYTDVLGENKIDIHEGLSFPRDWVFFLYNTLNFKVAHYFVVRYKPTS